MCGMERPDHLCGGGYPAVPCSWELLGSRHDSSQHSFFSSACGLLPLVGPIVFAPAVL